MDRNLSLRSEDGQAATELALVFPILLVILIAIAQFGILFNNYITLTDATRTGARKAAVSRFTGDQGTAAALAVRNRRIEPHSEQAQCQRLVDQLDRPRQRRDRHRHLSVRPQHSRLGHPVRQSHEHDEGEVGMNTLRREDGQVTVLAAVFIVVLLGMAGFVIDVGSWFRQQRAVQTTVDSAALAGAQALPAIRSTRAPWQRPSPERTAASPA